MGCGNLFPHPGIERLAVHRVMFAVSARACLRYRRGTGAGDGVGRRQPRSPGPRAGPSCWRSQFPAEEEKTKKQRRREEEEKERQWRREEKKTKKQRRREEAEEDGLSVVRTRTVSPVRGLHLYCRRSKWRSGGCNRFEMKHVILR